MPVITVAAAVVVVVDMVVTRVNNTGTIPIRTALLLQAATKGTGFFVSNKPRSPQQAPYGGYPQGQPPPGPGYGYPHPPPQPYGGYQQVRSLP